MALRNEDFRKMLATPRPGARPNLDAQASEAERQKKPRPPRPQRPKPKADGERSKEETEEEEAARYRDRAAERRKGDDLEGAMPAGVPGVLGGAQAADLSHLTFEESKFLGGDIDHTHLVKGLDYALLNKIKSEQAAAQRGGGREAGGAAPEDGAAAGGAEPAAAPREVNFKTPTGRAIHDFFFSGQRRVPRGSVAEQFLPRRTAFVFELDDPLASDVPTTLRRSKDDCPAVKERVMAGLDAAVLERMAKIMAYMSLAGGGRKKLKKKERQELLQRHGLNVQGALRGGEAEPSGAAEGPAPPPGEAAPGPARPVDEDEDIFGDAGTEYVVERRKAAEGGEEGPALPAAGKRSYFGGAEQGEPELGPAAPPAHGAGEGYPEADTYPDTDAAYPDTDAAYAAAEAEAAAEAAAEAQRERERDEKRKRLLAADADDGYAECYPAYHDAAGTAYDSEDDEGKGLPPAEAADDKDAGGGADDGGEGAGAKGGKGGKGGGAARRDALKARLKETSKISSELGKIKDIFSEKGYKHDTAFDKGKGGKEGKSRHDRAGAADDNGDLPMAMPAKKRRI